MGEADNKEDKKERRFSQEQYDMLKRCSDKKDMTEWNEWRGKNPDEDIWLEGAPLKGFYLEEAYLYSDFCFGVPELRGYVHLSGADLREANLDRAILVNAQLEGVKLKSSSLRSAHFMGATVDGNTNMWKVRVDPFSFSVAKDWLYTDFSGVSLQSVIIDPPTKQLIEYNIRRKYWYKWTTQKDWSETAYRRNIKRSVLDKITRCPIHLFFWISDYGMNTRRVMGVFFILALLFATVYMNWAYWSPPGIVSNLVVQPGDGEAAWHYFGRAVIRPIYFSVVTMTTLGFGDMYANKESIAGHVLLILQVILGYVLLGALVTRFAVLFTAGGPAGKFAKGKKNPSIN